MWRLEEFWPRGSHWWRYLHTQSGAWISPWLSPAPTRHGASCDLYVRPDTAPFIATAVLEWIRSSGAMVDPRSDRVVAKSTVESKQIGGAGPEGHWVSCGRQVDKRIDGSMSRAP